MAARFAPWPEASAVDTDRPVSEVADRVRVVGGWSDGLT
jgi:hypothetical protein